MPAWLRMGGRAVECIGLENRRLFAGSVSSNLTPSASFRQFGFSEPFFKARPHAKNECPAAIGSGKNSVSAF